MRYREVVNESLIFDTKLVKCILYYLYEPSWFCSTVLLGVSKANIINKALSKSSASNNYCCLGATKLGLLTGNVLVQSLKSLKLVTPFRLMRKYAFA